MLSEFIIDVLATYRGTRLIVEDEIMEPVREKIWEKHSVSDSKLGYAISCPFCTSVWVGGAISVAKLAAPKLSRPLRYGLALSAMTCLYEDWRNR